MSVCEAWDWSPNSASSHSSNLPDYIVYFGYGEMVTVLNMAEKLFDPESEPSTSSPTEPIFKVFKDPVSESFFQFVRVQDRTEFREMWIHLFALCLNCLLLKLGPLSHSDTQDTFSQKHGHTAVACETLVRVQGTCLIWENLSYRA